MKIKAMSIDEALRRLRLMRDMQTPSPHGDAATVSEATLLTDVVARACTAIVELHDVIDGSTVAPSDQELTDALLDRGSWRYLAANHAIGFVQGGPDDRDAVLAGGRAWWWRHDRTGRCIQRSGTPLASTREDGFVALLGAAARGEVPWCSGCGARLATRKSQVVDNCTACDQCYESSLRDGRITAICWRELPYAATLRVAMEETQ